MNKVKYNTMDEAIIKGFKAQVDAAVNALPDRVDAITDEFLGQLGRLVLLGKKIEATRTEITSPINDSLRKINMIFSPVAARVKEQEQAMRQQILAVRAKGALRIGTEGAKLEKQLAAGKITGVEAAQQMKQIAKEVQAERVINYHDQELALKISFRESNDVVIDNPKSIPNEYLVPDRRKIIEELAAGKKVKGAKLVTVETAVVAVS